MRRHDREVSGFDDIIKIIKKCDICRLAFNDGEYPYILPLNFGMQVESGKAALYFHGAMEGKKYELIARNNRAGFEMDCVRGLVTEEESGNCTMIYESVIGHGVIEFVPDSEKYDALIILMKHYHKEDFPFNQALIPYTTVFKLTVEAMTGKQRGE